MNGQAILFLTPYLVSLTISAGVGVYAWRHRDVAGARPYALVALGEALWILGYVFELISPSLETKAFWDSFQWLGVLAWPPLFLAFAFEYTGDRPAHPWRTWGLLSIVPITFFLLVLTNDLHGWIQPAPRLVPGEPFPALVYDFTAAVYLIAIYSYGLVFAGLFVLVKRFTHHLYRGQVATVLIGSLIPLLGSVLTMAGIAPTLHRDLSPFTFALGNLVVAWGLFHYRLFDVVPVARHAVMESMSDAVFVLDAQNRVVDLNPAAQALVGRKAAEAIGQQATLIFSDWPDLIEKYRDVEEVSTEISVGVGKNQRHADLKLSPLRDWRGRLTGRLIVVRDITARKRAETALKEAHDGLERRVEERTAELAEVVAILRAQVDERMRAEEALRRRTEELEALRQMGLALAAQLDLDVLLHSIVSRAVELLGGTIGGLYLYRPDRAMLEVAVAVGVDPAIVGTLLHPGEGLSGKVWETGEPLAVEDYQRWEGRAVIFDDQNFRAAVGVPIRWGPARAGEELLGVLDVVADRPGVFTSADAELLSLFATQAAIAIENAHLFRAEREQRRLAEALHRAAAAASSTLDLDEVLDRVLEQVDSVIPADAAKILLVEGESARVVRWRGYEHLDAPDAVGLVAFHIPDTRALRQMQETGRSIIIPDTRDYPGWLRVPEMEWIRSYAAVPIRTRDQILGFLTVDSATPGFFDASHAERLQTFANQAALAIENAHLFQDLQDQMEELQRTQAQLVQSAKMAAIGQLAAGVAHEINNPMTGVLGFSDLLLRSMDRDDPAWESLNIVVREAHRVREMVRNLLDFSRQTESRRQKAAIGEIVQETVALVRPRLGRKGVRLEQDCAPDLPLLWLDPNQMKQVVLNLVTNALQATPRGGTVTVICQRVGDEVAIRVADTGAGIPDEILPRIFEPFFTTKPIGQGTGLGLSISQGIVEDHGGRIEVESQVGKGSTFTVWLSLPSS